MFTQWAYGSQWPNLFATGRKWQKNCFEIGVKTFCLYQLYTRVVKNSATTEFLQSDRPRSGFPPKLLKFIRKNWENYCKNIAIENNHSCLIKWELWCCVNQMQNLPNFPSKSSKQNVRSGLLSLYLAFLYSMQVLTIFSGYLWIFLEYLKGLLWF